MNHPTVFYQLAKIKQAEMWRDAEAQRLAQVERQPSAFPTRPAALVLVVTALAGIVKLFLG